MQSVRVDKHELLDILKTNRDGHREDFLEGLEGYKKILLGVLDERKATIERRIEKLKKGGMVSMHIEAIYLPEPEDHTSDYDRAISMLEMSLDTEIELPEQDFQRYVLNDWEWKESFFNNTLSYCSGQQ